MAAVAHRARTGALLAGTIFAGPIVARSIFAGHRVVLRSLHIARRAIGTRTARGAVAGLPPAPGGRTYQLWYVGSDEVARSAGLLTADREGRGELLLDGDATTAAAVGMTLEPAGGSPRPTTDPIVVLALT